MSARAVQHEQLRLTIGPVKIERYDAETESDWTGAYYVYNEGRPAAVEASCVLTVWFGPTSRAPHRSKRLRGFGRFTGEPTDEAWQTAEEEARAELAVLLARHGVGGD